MSGARILGPNETFTVDDWDRWLGDELNAWLFHANTEPRPFWPLSVARDEPDLAGAVAYEIEVLTAGRVGRAADAATRRVIRWRIHADPVEALAFWTRCGALLDANEFLEALKRAASNLIPGAAQEREEAVLILLAAASSRLGLDDAIDLATQFERIGILTPTISAECVALRARHNLSRLVEEVDQSRFLRVAKGDSLEIMRLMARVMEYYSLSEIETAILSVDGEWKRKRPLMLALQTLACAGGDQKSELDAPVVSVAEKALRLTLPVAKLGSSLSKTENHG